MYKWLVQRWHIPGGFREVLRLALPLVISTSAHTLQMFTDRVFLMWHGQDSMSAAMQSGLTHFTALSVFFGIASYVNTFVAQYIGAGRKQRVGPAVWQGIYFSIVGGLILLAMIPLAPTLFRWFGHSAAIRAYEITYFNYLCMASLPILISVTISAFYTAQKKTMIVMYVTIIGAISNVALDYVLIFGKFGFPRCGFTGAPLATLIAALISMAIYLALFFRRQERSEFNTFRGVKPEFELFTRMIRYGLPNGVHIFFEVLPFTLFMMFIGRMSEVGYVATTIAFQINTLGFLPMIGFGIAVTTLVGQALGQNDPVLARQTTWSAACLTIIYMVLIAIGFVAIPEFFLYPFAAHSNPQDFAEVKPIVINLLYFIAFYCLFDTGNIIFSATLKGAGDTRYVMIMSILLNWTLLIIPSYIAWKFNWSIYTIWAFATAFVCALAISYFLRFLSGKWEKMRVIESAPLSVPAMIVDVPTVEPETLATDKEIIRPEDPKDLR